MHLILHTLTHALTHTHCAGGLGSKHLMLPQGKYSLLRTCYSQLPVSEVNPPNRKTAEQTHSVCLFLPAELCIDIRHFKAKSLGSNLLKYIILQQIFKKEALITPLKLTRVL